MRGAPLHREARIKQTNKSGLFIHLSIFSQVIPGSGAARAVLRGGVHDVRGEQEQPRHLGGLLPAARLQKRCAPAE